MEAHRNYPCELWVVCGREKCLWEVEVERNCAVAGGAGLLCVPAGQWAGLLYQSVGVNQLELDR